MIAEPSPPRVPTLPEFLRMIDQSFEDQPQVTQIKQAREQLRYCARVLSIDPSTLPQGEQWRHRKAVEAIIEGLTAMFSGSIGLTSLRNTSGRLPGKVGQFCRGFRGVATWFRSRIAGLCSRLFRP